MIFYEMERNLFKQEVNSETINYFFYSFAFNFSFV